MRVSKMYELEKMIKKYKDDNKTDMSEQIANICHLTNYKITSEEESDYIQGAIAIPYSNMVVLIHYYHNSFMEESTSYRFIDRISKEYGISGDLFVKRFHFVDKLSRSLFYKKKIAELYNGSKKTEMINETKKQI